jgi:hypothetical protein
LKVYDTECEQKATFDFKQRVWQIAAEALTSFCEAENINWGGGGQRDHGANRDGSIII